MARFVNDQAVLRRGDGPFRPFGGAPTLRGLLFPASEPGFTFEPWDITTLYQDRAGTTPVTAAGQSVGLRLSKDQGLRIGPELREMGVVSTVGLPGTLATFNTSTGAGSAYRLDGSNVSGVQLPVTDGRTYLLDVEQLTGSLQIRGNGVAGNQLVTSVVGRQTYRLFVAAGEDLFFVTGANAASVTFIVHSVRELAGNHQVAVSDAKRGVYGWMPKTGKRNLLTYTEQFDNDAWVVASGTATKTANTTTSPDGNTTADTISATSASAIVWQTYVPSAGSSYSGFVYLKRKTGTGNVNFTADGSTYIAVDLSGGGWVRATQTYTASAGTKAVGVQITTSGDEVYIWGAQLELGSTATAYQRVVSQYDITEAGVPTCYYVQADGVDDAYVTPTITPNTDKAQVFAGVRKLSDAAIGMVCEFSPNVNTNAGTFWMAAPIGAGAANYDFSSKGTTGQSKSRSGFAAPHSAVLTGLGDISADSVNLRVNGNDAGAFGGDQGTGNYLAYPAYIYSRGGTSLPFNGLDFGHAVRFGPNLDAATIARVEALIARNTPEVDFMFGGVWNDGYAWNDNTNWNDGA